ncbi:AMP-binding protein [Gordonia pseudamarae]|uniref:AMP-binding protein n=1 Tax=Gordonia pseudamarae TaxID=2831662 RepID=A0ABX6IH38_9ACTN|nr:MULTISPECIES: AMP-binding protein [Gordonia]MBD0022527.1 AMP-binding protein [Gordonia sp. (in: high G+C Gram-positive bacteria)]QHN26290.1 AMP-binding protein [Gordonia pseudamarae]QHN35182.1 AMP-binding protein [Gordonia pseudamarae]
MADMRLWRLMYEPLDRACRYYPARTAVIDGERRLTYAELGAFTNRVANGFIELGLKPGEAVGMLMPNCLEFIPTQHGLWKSGGVMVQMPARASAHDHAYFLNAASATTLVYHELFADIVDQLRAQCPTVRRFIRIPAVPASATEVSEPSDELSFKEVFDNQPATPPSIHVEPEDLVSISFTSGSTGQPKAVKNSHERTLHMHIPSGTEIGDVRAGEVFALGAPLTHFAQIFVLPTLLHGGTLVLLPGLDVDLLFDVVEQHAVTATALVPTVIYQMLNHPRRDEVDLSSLRTVVYAGSPIAPDRLRSAIELFGQVFTQTYAGTEPGFMTCLTKDDHDLNDPAAVGRLGSAGRAMSHVELSIQDDQDRVLPVGEVGEICCRQPGRMVGYVDAAQDAGTIRDSWVHTGDIGYVDELGYVYVVDRKKDMVVTGGFNVFPRQIEDVLLTHPDVAQCAVIGVPDEKWGEAVKAIVVSTPDSAVGADDLKTLVKERKGGVWAPKSIDFVDDLPLTTTGKVDKKALKAPFWRDQDRLVH